MFTKKEIEYIKQAVYSDIDGNCNPPVDKDAHLLSNDKFPDLPSEEVDFLKSFYKKICDMEV